MQGNKKENDRRLRQFQEENVEGSKKKRKSSLRNACKEIPSHRDMFPTPFVNSAGFRITMENFLKNCYGKFFRCLLRWNFWLSLPYLLYRMWHSQKSKEQCAARAKESCWNGPSIAEEIRAIGGEEAGEDIECPIHLISVEWKRFKTLLNPKKRDREDICNSTEYAGCRVYIRRFSCDWFMLRYSTFGNGELQSRKKSQRVWESDFPPLSIFSQKCSWLNNVENRKFLCVCSSLVSIKRSTPYSIKS